MGLLIPRVSDRQLKAAVAFETAAFTFTYVFATLKETHIVTETYAFLHIPVLANCRQSTWGNSGVFGKKSCSMCRLDA